MANNRVSRTCRDSPQATSLSSRSVSSPLASPHLAQFSLTMTLCSNNEPGSNLSLSTRSVCRLSHFERARQTATLTPHFLRPPPSLSRTATPADWIPSSHAGATSADRLRAPSDAPAADDDGLPRRNGRHGSPRSPPSSSDRVQLVGTRRWSPVAVPFDLHARRKPPTTDCDGLSPPSADAIRRASPASTDRVRTTAESSAAVPAEQPAADRSGSGRDPMGPHPGGKEALRPDLPCLGPERDGLHSR